MPARLRGQSNGGRGGNTRRLRARRSSAAARQGLSELRCVAASLVARDGSRDVMLVFEAAGPRLGGGVWGEAQIGQCPA